MEPASEALKRRAASALHHLLLAGAAAGMLVLGMRDNAPLTAAALLAGWLAGSLVEYSVHRFVLHGLALTARVHARHHAAPAQEQIDPISYFGPILVALLVWTALRLLSGEAPPASGFTAGLCLQYSWFRAYHCRMHRPGHRLASGARARFHRGHHIEPHCNFGVTTPLWDMLFRTRRPLRAGPGDDA
jgi:sterol desaturase/sphingolipid hydroxylase (fatty acid hydroxylase superfamily)